MIQFSQVKNMEKSLEAARPVVLETLANACSQNADVLKPAEQKLQQWETEPGFYSILTVTVIFIVSFSVFDYGMVHFWATTVYLWILCLHFFLHHFLSSAWCRSIFLLIPSQLDSGSVSAWYMQHHIAPTTIFTHVYCNYLCTALSWGS